MNTCQNNARKITYQRVEKYRNENSTTTRESAIGVNLQKQIRRCINECLGEDCKNFGKNRCSVSKNQLELTGEQNFNLNPVIGNIY